MNGAPSQLLIGLIHRLDVVCNHEVGKQNVQKLTSVQAIGLFLFGISIVACGGILLRVELIFLMLLLPDVSNCSLGFFCWRSKLLDIPWASAHKMGDQRTTLD
jgi:hypothetical protein